MKPFYYCHAIAEPLREASDIETITFLNGNENASV